MPQRSAASPLISKAIRAIVISIVVYKWYIRINHTKEIRMQKGEFAVSQTSIIFHFII